MIINTNKTYEMTDILNFMSDLVANRISNGFKIDFEQEFYIRNCSNIENEIGETYMVTTNDVDSFLTYIEGDFNEYEDIIIWERLFEPGSIDDESFEMSKPEPVARFRANEDEEYHLEGIRFNL